MLSKVVKGFFIKYLLIKRSKVINTSFCM